MPLSGVAVNHLSRLLAYLRGRTVEGATVTYGIQLTRKRQELLEWFERNAPALRGAYEAAIRLLNSPGFPAREHLIGHLVREIANRLPDVLEGTQSPRAPYEDMMDAIAPEWSKHFHRKEDYTVGPPSSHPRGERLPSRLFKKFDKLVAKHLESRKLPKHQRLFSRAMNEDVDSPEVLAPIMKQYRDLCRWFMELTHLGNKPRESPSEQTLVQNFGNFERVLLGIIGQFFTNIGELDEILQDTNT